MQQIMRPQNQNTGMTKAIGMGKVGVGALGLATGNPSTLAGAGQMGGSGLSVASGLNDMRDKGNGSNQVPYSPMAQRLQVQQAQPQENLRILQNGEAALNKIAQTHPDIAKEYAQPLYETMISAHRDPIYKQYINPEWS